MNAIPRTDTAFPPAHHTLGQVHTSGPDRGSRDRKAAGDVPDPVAGLPVALTLPTPRPDGRVARNLALARASTESLGREVIPLRPEEATERDLLVAWWQELLSQAPTLERIEAWLLAVNRRALWAEGGELVLARAAEVFRDCAAHGLPAACFTSASLSRTATYPTFDRLPAVGAIVRFLLELVRDWRWQLAQLERMPVEVPALSPPAPREPPSAAEIEAVHASALEVKRVCKSAEAAHRPLGGLRPR